MFKRRFHLALLALSAFTVSLPASEPWKSKPVQDLSLEETRGLLQESPWVHQVLVHLSALGSPSRSGREEGAGNTGEGGFRAIPDPTVADMDGSSLKSVPFYVLWSSALIVRQAIRHLAALRNKAEEETEITPVSSYVLTVVGPDLSAFEGAAEASLIKAAYLSPSRSKTRVEPSQVNVQRGSNGRIVSVDFLFPREAGGLPLVTEEEKSLEFACKIQGLNLKTKFKLRDMTTAQGKDL